MASDKLTPKQRAFVQEYLVDLNATQAAIRAGYSPKTANVTACETLTKPYVAEAIRQALDKRAERTEISADWVLNQLIETQDAAYADKQFSASIRALELIGKHLGMFKDVKGDDNARKTLDALVKLFSKRNESGDGHVIDVPPNEQPPGSVRALVESRK